MCALAKEIQWSWPEQLGEDHFVVMMGALHIEIAALRLLGDWLEGSGWTSLLESAEVFTRGVAESLLKASHVTRIRLGHQITAATLYALQQRAFEQREDKATSLDEWTKSQAQKQPMFAY